MLAKLQKELDTFLADYNIVGLKIFRDWIFKQAGLSDDCQKYGHFYSYNHFSSDDNFYLRLQGLDKENRDKLLVFLRINDVDSHYIKLQEALIFQRLLPDFIASMRNNTAFSNAKLLSYQLLSTSVLLSQQAPAEHKREVALNKDFYKDIDNILNPLKITASKCDFFEHVLVELAGCSYKPNSQFNFFTNDLRAYFNFYYDNEVDSDVEQLLQFFNDCMDTSALITRKSRPQPTDDKYREFAAFKKTHPALTEEELYPLFNQQRDKFGYRNPINGLILKSGELRAYFCTGKMPVCYTLSVDAKLFRYHVWPKIRNQIIYLAQHEPHVLVSYQVLCASYFQLKLSTSPHSFYQPYHPIRDKINALSEAISHVCTLL